jgi:protein-disulfide isomerase
MSEGTSGSFMERYGTPLAVLGGAVIIAFAFAFGGGDRQAGAPTGEAPAVAVDIKDVETNSPYIGNENAPVTMAVWYDFQCSFCKRYDVDTLSKLKATHVDTGKVRIVFKDYQFFPGSEDVAVFGRALWEAHPDQYYTWFSGMMALPTGEGSGLTVAMAKDVATGVAGVNVDRVERLATDKRAEYLAAIQADRAEGTGFGINGTPASIIGTQMLAGAQPLPAVQAALDAELQ